MVILNRFVCMHQRLNMKFVVRRVDGVLKAFIFKSPGVKGVVQWELARRSSIPRPMACCLAFDVGNAVQASLL